MCKPTLKEIRAKSGRIGAAKRWPVKAGKTHGIRITDAAYAKYKMLPIELRTAHVSEAIERGFADMIED